MKTEEDEAFDELARKQGAWGGGFKAKQAMAADKLQEPVRGALKLALITLEGWDNHDKWVWPETALEQAKRNTKEAITAIKEALAQPAQEPVAWQTMEAKYPSLEKLDIRMGDGSILCDVWPQSDGDLWWEGSGTGEKFIDPKYANVTHWRVHSDTTPPQREWAGLTDEEIYMNCPNWLSQEQCKVWIQQVEAKLKEKNT